MANVIHMQDMRYLNLFEKVSGIRTRFCFEYNNTIFFCVPKQLVSKAIGESARNLKIVGTTIARKVKVIFFPMSTNDTKAFIEKIIEPVSFKDISITEKEITITAGGMQNKAALFGRGKQRLEEMKKITQTFFRRDYRVA